MKYVKVENEPALVRDSKSKAILNVNTEALNKYKKEKEQALKIKNMLEEHESMKQDISDIKRMLLQLMEK